MALSASCFGLEASGSSAFILQLRSATRFLRSAMRHVGQPPCPVVRGIFGRVSAAEPADAAPRPSGSADIEALLPMVRRIVGARVADQELAEDLVQETLVRVLSAAGRVEPGMLEPYAIATARNVIASRWKQQDRHRRNLHRVVDFEPVEPPDEGLLAREEQTAVARALKRLSEPDQRILLAHEVSGQDTRSLAQEVGSSAGAVAAALNRARARMRVEYLLVLERTEPPTDRCRAVLLTLSSGDRRRQREVRENHPPRGRDP